MTMRIISIGVLIAAQSLLACGDGEDGDQDEGQGATIEPAQVTADLTAALCEAAGACECETGPSQVSACPDAIAPAIAGRVAAGEALGLRFHAECLERMTAYLDAIACRTAIESEGDAALAQLHWDAQRCKVLAGGDLLGDPCASAGGIDLVSLGDSCAQGLYCAERCYELVEAEGESCAFGTCPPGTACLDPDADGVLTCEARPAAGERCNPHAHDCRGDLVCDPMQLVCIDPPGPGDECFEGWCAPGNQCTNGVCEPLPGDGDPCGPLGCAEGLRCNYDTVTCAPPVEEGEPCLYVQDCALDLQCDPDSLTCAPFPGEGDECPLGLCGPDLRCGFDYVCAAVPPLTCELPFCPYRFDGLCDEADGTGLCQDGTDPEDCDAAVTAPGLTSREG